MPTTVSLTIGGRRVSLARSVTQIALKAALGLGASLEGEIRSLEIRRPTARRGRLGGFEMVEMLASAAENLSERARLRSTASVEEETPVYHTSDDGVPFIPEGTIFLSFKQDVSDDRKQEIIEEHALLIVRSERDGFLTVRPTVGEFDAVEVAARLQEEGDVDVASPDLVTQKLLTELVLPADEFLEQEWHLENRGVHAGETIGYKKGADARVIAAWKAMQSLGSDQVSIGVIDDGFDLSHPDLAGKAVDPWDFVRNSSDVSPDRQTDAGDWHGTACAGVAAGSAGEGLMVGVAPLARITPVRSGDLAATEIAKWFDYMTERGVWVVSCSWGAAAANYPLDDRVSKAISRCAHDGRDGRGAVIVFAAGNKSQSINDGVLLNGFAVHPDIVAVAGSTSRDRRSDRSSFGKEIWVCAPSGGGGRGIITADVQGTYVDAQGVTRNMGYDSGAYFRSFSGTSAACPVVAGVCALILSANPALTGGEVRAILKQTARRIGEDADYAPDGHSPHFGFGCVDAEAAVKEALGRLTS